MTTYIVKFDRPLSHVATTTSGVDDARETPASEAEKLELASRQTVERVLKQISAQVAQLDALQRDNIQQLKSMSVQLAGIIVRKIVGNSESLNTERLEHLLDEALAKTDPLICVRVNPADQSKMHAAIAGVSVAHQPLEIIADESIATGECRCEYAGFELTSDLDRHVESIEHRLLEVIHD